MAVTSIFTWILTSGTLGIAPFTIVFADASTGSPDGWSWNFDDGSSSNSQNISHTFQTNGSFIVTLLTYKKNGGTSLINPDFITRRTKNSAPPGNDPAIEYDEFLAASWTTYETDFNASYSHMHPGTFTYQYETNERTFDFDLSSNPDATNIANLQYKINNAITIPESIMNIESLSISLNITSPINVWRFLADISTYLGSTTPPLEAKDAFYLVLSTPPTTADRSGWVVDFRVIIQPISSKDSSSQSIGEFTDISDDIDFTATPRKGILDIDSLFDITGVTSTITSVSFLRRPSGIGASYTKYAIIVNPTENFNIEIPEP